MIRKRRTLKINKSLTSRRYLHRPVLLKNPLFQARLGIKTWMRTRQVINLSKRL